MCNTFVSELARVAAPGGTIIIVTCCHRNLEPSETSLKPDELSLLKRISDAYCLADWCPPSDYVNIAKSLLLELNNKNKLFVFWMNLKDRGMFRLQMRDQYLNDTTEFLIYPLQDHTDLDIYLKSCDFI